ncbi:MAG: hypothetical protein BWX71_02305 [Deltaproteobacteria bacterium ADurb.Bin072]|nr:MAG: hypothetical protein BWX71_02305 [Deltaproteobacteria bacterium ADurb.Bin072]
MVNQVVQGLQALLAALDDLLGRFAQIRVRNDLERLEILHDGHQRGAHLVAHEGDEAPLHALLLLPQAVRLDLEGPVFEATLGHCTDLVRGEGFGEVVVGPLLHGLHCGNDGRVPGDHDEDHAGHLLGQEIDDIHSRTARHLQVDEGEVGLPGPRQTYAFMTVRGRHHRVAGLLKGLPASVEDGLLIVYDEDLRRAVLPVLHKPLPQELANVFEQVVRLDGLVEDHVHGWELIGRLERLVGPLEVDRAEHDKGDLLARLRGPQP